ncbi:hypothetical protein A3A38_01440 [Candidatus Kaiserbacteria bacterium RIFCSPLOWO2_01_FULL_53_17]|uniref:DUF5666 domain-containing protein n=1 Tax=Candidatus Kaiserbacteria bacterium RIFCSPLOWO2_01_FULL_53_17 TaxID=1798511 RepID=A0A1F6EI61_9BACT|nr:MAG: hypothetical protein A3A38_01440 [Candidatus Kaiserbacteria bacterium RIFCSPLOWO2_01_FULL_53_17]
MKSLTTTILATALILPGLAFAASDPFDVYVERMIKAAQEGNGTVIIENSSSISTGGQTAASGEAVSTGPSSASSKVETHINANNSGGSVEVKIETSKDGVVETKEYSKELGPDEPVNVNVSAEVNTEGTKVEVRGWDPVVKKEAAMEENASSTETADDAEAAVGIETEIKTSIEKALKAVPNFFKRIFSFFWRF